MKNRFFTYGAAALMTAAMVTGCSSEENTLYSDFKIFMDEVLFETEGGSETVTFRSPGDWMVQYKDSVDWIRVVPEQGKKGTVKLVVQTDENATMEQRTGEVYLVCGEDKQVLNVVQEAKDAIVSENDCIEVDSEGGSVTFQVKSNIDYTYEIEPAAQGWIHGDMTRAVKESVVQLYVDRNEGFESRFGKIILRNGDVKETIAIQQAGQQPILEVSMDEYRVDDRDNTIKVEIIANVDYEIRMPDVDWIKKDNAFVDESNTLYFTTEVNETFDERTAEIVIFNQKYDLKKTVKVIQAQNNLFAIEKTVYTVPGNGGEISVKVTSNVDVDMRIEEGWIQQKQSKAVSEKEYVFVISKNESERKREGLIHFSHQMENITVKVVQEAASYIRLDKNEIEILRGDSYKLGAKTNYSDAIIWSSDDRSIADVDNKGIITAKGLGTALISVSYSDKIVKDTCRVTVKDITGFVQCGAEYNSSLNQYVTQQYIDFYIVNNSSRNIELVDFTVNNKETGKQYAFLNDKGRMGTLKAGEKRIIQLSANPIDFQTEFIWNFTYEGRKHSVKNWF